MAYVAPRIFEAYDQQWGKTMLGDKQWGKKELRKSNLLRIMAIGVDEPTVEVLRQKIGQVKRPGFGIRQLRETTRTGVELVTMCARKSLDITTFFFKYSIDGAAGSAVRVSDIDLVVVIFVTTNFLA